MPQGLGHSLHHSSSSLVSNNFAMTGPDLGEQAQGVVWVVMADPVEPPQEVVQTVLHSSMWYMAHLRVGRWAQASVSNNYLFYLTFYTATRFTNMGRVSAAVHD